jgi:hypothetical protein
MPGKKTVEGHPPNPLRPLKHRADFYCEPEDDERTEEDWRSLLAQLEICFNEKELWMPCSAHLGKGNGHIRKEHTS